MNLFWVVLEKRRYVKKYNENRIDGREGGNRNVNYSAPFTITIITTIIVTQ